MAFAAIALNSLINRSGASMHLDAGDTVEADRASDLLLASHRKVLRQTRK